VHRFWQRTYGRLQRILKQEGAQALAQALEAAKP
jgi:hypothetical protein